MRVNINRCKRITAIVQEWIESVEQELHFKHPARGYTLYGLLLLTILLFDFNRLLEYVLLIMVVVAMWLNPTVRQVAW